MMSTLETPGPRTHPPRALVAECDLSIRTLVQDVLRAAGYGVDVESDGEELLERARQGAYDLLILSPWLPGMTGVEVVGRIRGHGSPLPVIFVCGPDPSRDRVDGVAHVYRAEVLRKPFGLGDLREVLRRALRSPAES
jgi:DNA-binding response OmpR family regulator